MDDEARRNLTARVIAAAEESQEMPQMGHGLIAAMAAEAVSGNNTALLLSGRKRNDGAVLARILGSAPTQNFRRMAEAALLDQSDLRGILMASVDTMKGQKPAEPKGFVDKLMGGFGGRR